MTAGTHNITIEQGATLTMVVTLMQEDGVTPRPLTGAEARMQVRTKAGVPDPPLIDISEVAGDDGQITIDEEAGQLTLVVISDVTAALTIKKGVYDLVLELPNGTVERILEGVATVSPGVTTPTHD